MWVKIDINREAMTTDTSIKYKPGAIGSVRTSLDVEQLHIHQGQIDTNLLSKVTFLCVLMCVCIALSSAIYVFNTVTGSQTSWQQYCLAACSHRGTSADRSDPSIAGS